MTIKTWQERLDETEQGIDWITLHKIQIKLMQDEIDELRAVLPADSKLWRDVAQEWQKKYESLLQGAPADRSAEALDAVGKNLAMLCMAEYQSVQGTMQANDETFYEIEETPDAYIVSVDFVMKIMKDKND